MMDAKSGGGGGAAAGEQMKVKLGGGLSCGDASETFKRWHQWRAHDRDEFLLKVCPSD
jgi:hypothetical protein